MTKNLSHQISHDIDVTNGVRAALEELRNCSDENFVEHVRNPSKVHELLFSGTSDQGDVVGKFRDKEMKIRERRGRNVNDITLVSPEDLQEVMGLWADDIELLVREKPDSEIGIAVIAKAMFYFLRAHPFFDGNGRTVRAFIVEICKRCGYSLSPKWTVAARPYDNHFLYGLKHYRSNPALLYGALKDFIDPIDIQKSQKFIENWASRSDCGHCSDHHSDLFDAISCYSKCELGDEPELQGGTKCKEDMTDQELAELGQLNSKVGSLVGHIEAELRSANLPVFVGGIYFTRDEEKSLGAIMRSGSDGCCTCASGQHNEWACPCSDCDTDYDIYTLLGF